MERISGGIEYHGLSGSDVVVEAIVEKMEIKKAAKAGNKAACTVLAKQLVQLRKQKQRTYVASSQVIMKYII